VVLRAHIVRQQGSDTESGTAVFKASRPGYSRIDVLLPSGNYSEINSDPLVKRGATNGWINSRNEQYLGALHNSWADHVWFFPALSYLGVASERGYVASYIGREVRDGGAVEHFRVCRATSSIAGDPYTKNLIADLSATDLPRDVSSGLNHV
jgi:hypothetical protein